MEGCGRSEGLQLYREREGNIFNCIFPQRCKLIMYVTRMVCFLPCVYIQYMFACASTQDCSHNCVSLFTSPRLTVSIFMVIGTNHLPAVLCFPSQNIKQSCTVCLLCLILQGAALTPAQDSAIVLTSSHSSVV